MERILRGKQQVAGGYLLEIEVTEAYTNGDSRFDKVFVAAADIRGKTLSQRKRAVADAIESAEIDELLNAPATAHIDDKDIIEDRMVSLYAAWQRWKVTRLEAELRNVAAPVVNALTAKEGAAWTAYTLAILDWRNAP